MQKRIIILFILILLSSTSFAQISISSEKYNAVKEIVKIPKGMTYGEFLKIQKQIDWKKIMIASILPGYIHFYADKPELGWTIAGARTIGYVLIGYAMYDQYQLTNSIDYGAAINSSEEEERTQNNAIYLASGIILNMIGFAFDWAHGDWVVEMERNEVYFKYGLDKERKSALGLSYNTQFKIPSIAFSLRL